MIRKIDAETANVISDMLIELCYDFDRWYGEGDEGLDDDAEMVEVILRGGNALLGAGYPPPAAFLKFSEWFTTAQAGRAGSYN